jgi:hypothetical protein
VFCPAPGNHRLDFALAKFLAMCIGNRSHGLRR